MAHEFIQQLHEDKSGYQVVLIIFQGDLGTFAHRLGKASSFDAQKQKIESETVRSGKLRIKYESGKQNTIGLCLPGSQQ
jgi:hypothetical protein